VGGATSAALSWTFFYSSSTRTKPSFVTYNVTYSNFCANTSVQFTNDSI
jgi:hypothetical protein